MAREVEELFGEGEGSPTARTAPALALALGGVLLAVLGMACLAAPGGVLVLLGLWWIDRELDRVDNGYLPADERDRVSRARTVVLACLGAVILLFVLQLLLYCGGFYQALGDVAFGLLQAYTPPPPSA